MSEITQAKQVTMSLIHKAETFVQRLQYLQAELDRIGIIQSVSENQANLGLATTKQLIEEVVARMETTQTTPGGKQLAAFGREALLHLNPNVLKYRTVDG